MKNTECYRRYHSLFISLKEVITDTQQNVLSSENSFFNRNINFFVKSYLITLCTYLESYLTEVAIWHCENINNRIKQACLPHNFLVWRINKKGFKEQDIKYIDADLKVDKGEISDNLSGNPYKTIKTFSYLGIDLVKSGDFNSNKDIINSIVTKRNNIIHHNDHANDVSLGDINGYIDSFLKYMMAIDEMIYDNR